MDDEYNQPTKIWRSGYVYILDYGEGKTFKIGYTTIDPEHRKRQIMKDNVIMPMHLVMSCYTLTNCYFLENMLQMNYDSLHQNGEWFKLDFPELVEIYQLFRIMGDAQLYDRWYEVVPKDWKMFFSHYAISTNLPLFEKDSSWSSQHETVGKILQGVEG